MLEHGLVPSIFFRFPGLISDREIVDEILAWGVVPIGSDAWLAIGQRPSQGSVILVHRNGNEPQGIRLFEKLLPALQSIGFTSLENGL